MKNTFTKSTGFVALVAVSLATSVSLAATSTKKIAQASVSKTAVQQKSALVNTQSTQSTVGSQAERNASVDSVTSASVTGTTTASIEKKSKISGSVLLLAEKSAFEDVTDTQRSTVDTQAHFKLGYKLNNGDKISVNQRLFYSQMTNPEKQTLGNPTLASARFEYTKPVQAVNNGAGAFVFRLSLPTTQDALDSNFLMAPAIIPALSWSVAPKLSLSYSGYYGVTVYGGNRKVVPDYMIDQLNDGVITESKITSTMAQTGPQRGNIYVVNALALEYEASKILSVSGSLGYSMGFSDFSNNGSNLKDRTSGYDLGVSGDVAVNDSLKLSAGVSQQIADNPRGIVDMSSGKSAPYFAELQFLRPEQTFYSVSASATF